jgi:F-type H+-transporting ATPase subunit epsilon
MDHHSNKHLQCVVVTPEQAVLEEPADFVAVPMLDGELGVLPGRAPLIGRLGTGELRLRSGVTTKRLFVDSGFVQVHNDTVTLLTSKAVDAGEINQQTVESEKASLEAKHATDAHEREETDKALERTRVMLRIAKKN